MTGMGGNVGGEMEKTVFEQQLKKKREGKKKKKKQPYSSPPTNQSHYLCWLMLSRFIV